MFQDLFSVMFLQLQLQNKFHYLRQLLLNKLRYVKYFDQLLIPEQMVR